MSKLDIIPVDIKHKEFSSSMMGYNKNEVRQFLDMVSNQMEEIMKSEPVQEERPKPAFLDEKEDVEEEKKVSIVKEREDLHHREELISRTLLIAEKTKTEILDNAKKEAENILKDSEIKAKKMIEEARHYLNVLEHQYINIKEQKKQFLLHFRSEIEVLLNRINNDTILKEENEKQMDSKFNAIKNDDGFDKDFKPTNVPSVKNDDIKIEISEEDVDDSNEKISR